MLGYTEEDINDMINCINIAKDTFDNDEEIAVYNRLDQAEAFLEGLLAEGYFD